MDFILQPWPWYIAGPLIGLTVPMLLILGNKKFGISSTLRHICAAVIPGRVSFFKYDWKKETWNLFFAAGILIGAFLAVQFLSESKPVEVNASLASDLAQYGVTNYYGMVPGELFSWDSLLTARGLIMIVGGGFLIGFGTRYAGGCTSGHSISGLANLQWPSLVATICFMIGGFIMANLLLPLILSI
jgi:uncharacterized protein